MAGDPHPHTKSEGLKRLMRRRGRRTKPRANSGEKIYSWAEYSQVNFTPSGDHSQAGWIAVGVFFIAWVVLSFGFNLLETASPHSTDAVMITITIAAFVIGVVAFVLGFLGFLLFTGRTFLDMLAEARERKRKRAASTRELNANHGT